MKNDLLRLKRETESGLKKTGRQETSPLRVVTRSFQGSPAHRKYLLLGLSGLLLTILMAVVVAWWHEHRSGGSSLAGGRSTVAVLPLLNINNDPSIDYLGLALADEIANVLTHTRSLDVRPTVTTPKPLNEAPNPQKVGKELRVTTVLTGHYLRLDQQLIVTVEAIEFSSNRLLWQSTFNAPAQDLISLQSQMASQVRQGLLAVLGAAAGFLDTASQPKNREAYDLYLGTIGISHDVGPNKAAIAMLEQVVGMDPNYAPAWEALGQRYYYDANYALGASEMYQRSVAAEERALALDPNRTLAAGTLVMISAERGDLRTAYDQAKDLVTRRPQSAQAHFTMAYALRYAGMLEQSINECDNAVAIDEGNSRFRSCAWGFLELGKSQRALDFVKLDAGSEWSASVTASILLRQGKIEEARQIVRNISDNPRYHRDLLEACLHLRPSSQVDKIARDTAANVLAQIDPEPRYYEGAILAFCGQKEIALQLIRSAIDQNYCSSSALRYDPLLAHLRGTPEFAQLLTAAAACQKRLLGGGDQPTH